MASPTIRPRFEAGNAEGLKNACRPPTLHLRAVPLATPPGADRRSPGFQDLLACRSRVRGRAPGFPPGGSGAASLASCTVLGKVAPSPPVELSGNPEAAPTPGPSLPPALVPASPPCSSDLRVFTLVAVELAGFAPRQEASGGPRRPGSRLCSGRRRRRWRLGLLVIHNQRARTGGCRLHLGCSTPPAQFADGLPSGNSRVISSRKFPQSPHSVWRLVLNCATANHLPRSFT